jgi:hypothetical protein
MSKEEGFKIELVKPKLAETLIDVAHVPTFPFLVIQLEKTTKPQTFVSKVRVGPTLYGHLVKIYGTDKLVIYCDLPSGRIEAWTRDMLMSFRILNKLGIMSEPETWIAKTKEYIANIIMGKKPPYSAPPSPNEKALVTAREILNAAKLFDEVDEKINLVAVAKDVIISGAKDPDSIIYRLAMAMYHSKRIADEPAVAKLEDPGEAYLALTQNTEFCEKYRFIIEGFNEIPARARPEAVKTLMSFIIGAYLYNKALKLLEERK